MEEAMVEGLTKGDREAQIQAAGEIAKLSRKQRLKLVERGVIGPLILMLHSEDYGAIEASLFALLSLAFGSERSKIRIVKCGAIPAMLNLLQCNCKELVELIMAAMLTLSSCSANKLPIGSSGAITLLVEVLQEDHHRFSTQLKLDALATLHNLSTCHETIPFLVSSGISLALLQLVQASQKWSELTEKAMALLEDIVSASDVVLTEVAETDYGLPALVRIVEEGSARCREHAVRILLLICHSCRQKYRGLILREGVIPGLLQLSVDGTKRAKHLARELLFLLRDGSNCVTRTKKSNIEALEQIMQEIDAAGENVEGATLRLVEEMIAKLST